MYDVNTLTIKGVELLAAATASDKLVLDGCAATTTYVDQSTAANTQTVPASVLSTTTDVYLIGYTSNHVQARASFIAGSSTGGDANTLYLYGHKQSAPSDVFVIYVASSQESFHLPEVGDVANVYETLFDMIYAVNTDAVTTAGTSTYCSLAEFNALKGRVVTTHKEGESSVGDNQNIYGDKYFMDFVQCRNGLAVGGTDGFLVGAVHVSGNIVPVDNEEDPGVPYNDIGSSSIAFRNLYVANVYTETISNEAGVSLNDPVYFHDVVSVEYDIIPENEAVIHPVYPSGSDLGNNLRHFKTLYVYEIDGGSNLSVKSSIRCTGSVTPADGVTDTALGAFNAPWGYINGGGLRITNGSVGKAILSGSTPVFKSFATFSYNDTYSSGDVWLTAPGSNEVQIAKLQDGTGQFGVSVGGATRFTINYSSTYSRYEATYSVPLRVSGGLIGNQPSYSSSTRQLKIGSIFMAFFPQGASITYTGQEFHSASSNKLKFANVVGTTVQPANDDVPDGYYVCLNDVNPTGNTAWALVQCISLD